MSQNGRGMAADPMVKLPFSQHGILLVARRTYDSKDSTKCQQVAEIIENLLAFKWHPITLSLLYSCWSILTGESGKERLINADKLIKSTGVPSSLSRLGTVEPIVDRIVMPRLVTECRQLKRQPNHFDISHAIINIDLLLEIPWNEPTVCMLLACKNLLSDDEDRQRDGLRYIEDNLTKTTLDDIRGFAIPPQEPRRASLICPPE